MITNELLKEWTQEGTAAEQVAAFLFRVHVEGKESGYALPTNLDLVNLLQRSNNAVRDGKKILGDHGVIIKKSGRWVVI